MDSRRQTSAFNPPFRCHVAAVVFLVKYAAVGAVYWNPGDNIPRHANDFKWLKDYIAANNLGIPLERAVVSGGLNEEIVDMIGIMTDKTRPNYKELDIFRVEQTYVPPMAPYLYDFKQMFTDAELAAFDPRVLQAFTLDGKLFALPTFIDGSFLFYRKDLLKKYGYTNTDGSARPPKTWDDFDKMAQDIQDKERKAGNFIYGLTMQAMAIPILTMHMTSIIASHGGGNIIEKDGTVSVRNAKTKKALNRIKNWFATIASGDTKREHLHQTKQRFMENEESAFMIDLAHPAGELYTHTPRACSFNHVNCSKWTMYERVGITHIPNDGPGTKSTTSPHLWGMAIWKDSPRLDDAKKLARQFLNNDWQLMKARQLDPPTLKAVQNSVASTVCKTQAPPNVCGFDIGNQALVDRPVDLIRDKWYNINQPINFEGSFLGAAEDFMKTGLASEKVMDDWYCQFGRLMSPVAEWPTDLENQGVFCMCPAGKTRNGVNKASSPCTKCQKGTAKGATSNDACSSCSAGSFASSEGSTSCTMVPVGSYVNSSGASSTYSCSAIYPDFTTTGVGSQSAADCVCPKATWFDDRVGGSGRCMPCGEGLDCPIGSKWSNFMTKQKASRSGIQGFGVSEGYWMESMSLPFKLVACHAQKATILTLDDYTSPCPGGKVNSCRGDTTGRGCAICEDGYFHGDKDECQKCNTGLSFVFFILIWCILAGLSVVGLKLFNKQPECKISIFASTVIGFGSFVTVSQSLTALDAVELSWPTDIFPIFSLAGGSSAKVNSFLGIECVLGQGALGGYIFWLILPAAYAATIFLVAVAVRVVFKEGSPHRVTFHQASNTFCSVYQALFVAVALFTVAPMRCFTQPDGSSSMQSRVDVICFEGDHNSMVVFLCVSVLLNLVTFVAYYLYGTYIIPVAFNRSGVNNMDDPKSQQFRFIFYRFTPQAYYFGLFMLLRSLLLAILTSFGVGSKVLQLVVITGVFTICITVQCAIWPWKTGLLNRHDAGLSTMLVVMSSASAAAAANPGDSDVNSKSSMCVMVCYFLSVAWFLLIGAWTLYHSRVEWGKTDKMMTRLQGRWSTTSDRADRHTTKGSLISDRIVNFARQLLAMGTDAETHMKALVDNAITEVDSSRILRVLSLLRTPVYARGKLYELKPPSDEFYKRSKAEILWDVFGVASESLDDAKAAAPPLQQSAVPGANGSAVTKAELPPFSPPPSPRPSQAVPNPSPRLPHLRPVGTPGGTPGGTPRTPPAGGTPQGPTPR